MDFFYFSAAQMSSDDTANQSSLNLKNESKSFLMDLPQNQRKVFESLSKAQHKYKKAQTQWEEFSKPMNKNIREMSKELKEWLEQNKISCIDITDVSSDYRKTVMRKTATKKSSSASASAKTKPSKKSTQTRKRKEPPVKPCLLRLDYVSKYQTWSQKLLERWLEKLPESSIKKFREDINPSGPSGSSKLEKSEKSSSKASKKLEFSEDFRDTIESNCKQFCFSRSSVMKLTCSKPRAPRKDADDNDGEGEGDGEDDDDGGSRKRQKVSGGSSDSSSAGPSGPSAKADKTTHKPIIDFKDIGDSDKKTSIRKYLSSKDEFDQKKKDYTPTLQELKSAWQTIQSEAEEILKSSTSFKRHERERQQIQDRNAYDAKHQQQRNTVAGPQGPQGSQGLQSQQNASGQADAANASSSSAADTISDQTLQKMSKIVYDCPVSIASLSSDDEGDDKDAGASGKGDAGAGGEGEGEGEDDVDKYKPGHSMNLRQKMQIVKERVTYKDIATLLEHALVNLIRSKQDFTKAEFVQEVLRAYTSFTTKSGKVNYNVKFYDRNRAKKQDD